MQEALKKAQFYNARVILTGDTKQHTSVSRGDAMRLAEERTQLEQTELTKIFRQKPENYHKAIDHIQNGQTDEGFDLLDTMGAIIENENPEERYQKLAEDYAKIKKNGQSVWVISPTHLEGEHTTNFIRKELKNEGLLGKKDRQYQILKNRKLTKTQSRPKILEEGSIIQFHDGQIAKAHELQTSTPYTVKIDEHGFRYVETSPGADRTSFGRLLGTDVNGQPNHNPHQPKNNKQQVKTLRITRKNPSFCKKAGKIFIQSITSKIST